MWKKLGWVTCAVVLCASALTTAGTASAVDANITADALFNQANSYANGTKVGTGQCFSFGTEVFRIVAQNAGSSALIGNAGNGVDSSGGGYGYYGCYQHAGGVEVSQNEARRGDYIQIYDSANPWNAQPTITNGYSVHTAIIQDNLGGGVFNVIDENYTPLSVDRHQFTPANHIASCGGAPWKVAYWRLGSVGSTPPPTSPSRNLLTNASFEHNAGGWSTINNGGIVNYATYNNLVGRSHDGAGFMEMNTSVPGGSVYQDVAVAPSPGQSYTFSVWLRSPNGTPVSGTLALWGMGGTNEQGATNFTVGPQWTLVSAPLDVVNAGHTQLRAQIYISTAGAQFDADGATFARGNAAPAPVSPGAVAVTLSTITKLAGPYSVNVRRTLKLSGTVSLPAAPGKVTITMKRLVGKKWRSAGSARVSVSAGKFSYRCKPAHKGRWHFIATYSGGVVGTTTYKGSKSGVKAVRVK